MPIQPGQPAPDAHLVSFDRKEVNISDYQGQNVVLLFFPFAFTGVCTAELCAVRDDIATYQGLNAQVLGISVDSPATLTRFREDQQINFPLLSDFNKEACTAFECMYETFGQGLRGVAKRSAFVIDAQGIVRYAEVLDNAGELPHFEKVRETLASL